MSKRTPNVLTRTGRTLTVARIHPARYSDAHIELFDTLLHAPAYEQYLRIGLQYRVLDPMAGAFSIHRLDPAKYHTIGSELEAPYVKVGKALYPGRDCRQGDAANLDMADGSVDAIVVSPDYGNRLSDSHKIGNKCRACKGSGRTDAGECVKCKGAGTRNWVRRSYQHDLCELTDDPDYKLDPRSSARWKATQDEYWNRQAQYVAEAFRVLRSGGQYLVDVSDFVKNGKTINVVDRYADLIRGQGFEIDAVIPVPAARNRFGANRELRADGCRVIVAHKP